MRRHGFHAAAIAGLLVLGGVVATSCIEPRGSRATHPEPPTDSYRSRSLPMSGPVQLENVSGAEVTSAFFPATKAPPLLGRVFVAPDYEPVSTRVVVLHNDLWRGSFNAAPDVIGKAIQIDGRPHVVVGIMPPDFNFPPGAQFWVPVAR